FIVIPPAIFFYYSTLFDSRFKTLQQNQIFDINALNKEESELMKSNYYHDIYVKDSEVFVHVK
ncbi:TPA: hypothetical protein KG990_003205, partial [Enterococcus faecalis]